MNKNSASKGNETPYYMEISLQAKRSYRRKPRKPVKKVRLNIHKCTINNNQHKTPARIIYTPMGGQSKK